MGKTFAEKILGAKTGREVSAGEIVFVSPDVALSHDNSAAISDTFKKIGVDKVFDPSMLVIPLDHCVPAATEKYAENHKIIRAFVEEQGIEHFYDIDIGVCHQVLPEKGHALPGRLILGSDSHTTTYGAFGAFAAGVGRTEMAVIWATGKIWLRVPETFRVNVEGRFQKRVTSKDLILRIIGDLGADGGLYRAVEYSGEAIRDLSIPGRMVLCNMAVEMGCKIGYVVPDEKTDAWLKGRAVAEYKKVFSDDDAVYNENFEYNADTLEPSVACPHTVDNLKTVRDVAGTRIQQALIGTCTNGRVEDLEMAASLLKGKKIAKTTRLLIFPASKEIYIEAMHKGLLEIFLEAGAVVMNPGCGPCLGAHEGTLAPGEACLSTANRNFKGRMGCKEAEVYLASPYTVAASALTGKITDPREID
ncbi:MAG: 3-isopropylmalate dehydratase large subunit [Planctomycetes bacterium]|nr:3-isopropylmalate dehydratase large subunit [Planctomycetota bacterium]